MGHFKFSDRETTRMIFDLIEGQNELSTAGWRELNRKDNGSMAVITFAVDSVALEELQRIDFQVIYGFGQVVKIKEAEAIVRKVKKVKEPKKPSKAKDHKPNHNEEAATNQTANPLKAGTGKPGAAVGGAGVPISSSTPKSKADKVKEKGNGDAKSLSINK